MSTTIKILCANNAVGKLSTAITPSSTELVLSGSEGTKFPNAVAGVSAFYATLEDTAGNIETVLVTAKSGNTFTITRAQGGTAASAWPINTEVSNRVTAELLEDKVCLKDYTAGLATKVDKTGGSMTGGFVFNGNASITASSGGSSSTLELQPGGAARWAGNNIALLSWPIGSIFISVDGADPNTTIGGTWERIQGRFLLGADSTYTAGSTGGSSSYTFTTAEMPAHNHGGVTGEGGVHSHARGTMNITGTFGRAQCDYNYTSGVATGAFTASVSSGRTDGSHGNDPCIQWGFDASRSWTGSTSDSSTHTHTVSSQGSGAAKTILPPYLSVYMWKRIA